MNWFFTYTSAAGDQEADWVASDGSPYYREHAGQTWTYTRRRFIAENLSQASFWEAMRTVPCPREPQRPMEAPRSGPAEPKFGPWTIESALDAAARMSDEELMARCKFEPDFAAALDAARPPEVPVDRTPNNSSRDVAEWTRIREARVKRYSDSLKPLPDETLRLSAEDIYFKGAGFPATPQEKKPDTVAYPGYTKLIVRK